MTWPMKQQIEVLNKLAAMYTEKHPDYKVTFQTMEFAANEVLIKSQLQGGEAAALLNPFGGSSAAHHRSRFPDALGPVSGYAQSVRRRQAWKDTLHEEWLMRARYTGDNKLYTMPIYADMAGVFYNKSVFDKLQVQPPKTWDEWLALNEKLKAAGYEALGWMGAEVSPEVWLPGIMSDAVFRHLEEKLAGDPNFKLNLDDPYTDVKVQFKPGFAYCAWKNGVLNTRGDEVRFIFDRLGELVPYFQKGFTGSKWEDLMVSFTNQRVASFYGAGWLLPILQKTAADLPKEQQFEVGFFPIPGWGDKAIQPDGYDFTLAPMRSSTGGGAGNEIFALNAKSSEEDRKRAVDFVMWMISPEAQSAMWNSVMVGMFPISKDVPELPEAYKNPPAGGTAILQLGYEVGSGGGEFYQNNLNVMNKFFLGQASKEDTIKAYADNWEASWAVAAEKNGWTCK